MNENNFVMGSGHLFIGYRGILFHQRTQSLNCFIIQDDISKIVSTLLHHIQRGIKCPENEHLRSILTNYETKLKIWLINTKEKVNEYWDNLRIGVP